MSLCNGVGCGKPANLQCPICIEKQLKNLGYFCSQQCFKSNWAVHKSVHSSSNQQLGIESELLNNPWPWYKFTGSLRPYPQSATRFVPDNIERPDYRIKVLKSAYDGIKVLSEVEQQGVREAALVGRAVLDHAALQILPGTTTDKIDKAVHEKCIELGAYPSPLFYRGFPKSCCTSVNEIICHGIPDDRPLEDGDIVNVDISVYYKGYHSDLNETFLVGDKVDESSKALVNCARECLERAIAIVKPGTPYRNVGEVIEKYAHSCGFSVVRAYCGHGIHRFFHAAPNVPHYANNKAVGFMKVGHCFTIEQMINQGTWKDVTWPDNWTSATLDGKRSAQFEHTLLVTQEGCEVLTRKKEPEINEHL